MKKHILFLLAFLILKHTTLVQAATISEDQELLQGRWLQACQAGGVRTEFFVNNTVELNEMFFSDKDCRVPSAVFINEGTFVLPAQGQMDFQFTSLRVHVMNDAIINDFNRRQVCGFDDWEKSVDKEISGRSCEMFVIGSPQKIPTVGEMRYGIYRLDGDRLSFGKLSREQNATAPEKRPTEYDPRFYTRILRVKP
jgi:hypothetical protein